MSILINNEFDRLFSLALGPEWIRAGLLARTSDELKDVDTLATSNIDCALHQIAAIGNALGAERMDQPEVTQMAWAVAHLAEFANVASFMAATARELQNPEIRAFNKTIVDAAG